MKIRDRVIDQRKVPANTLRPSPHNWRTHPVHQRDALRGVFAEIGFAGAELVRELPDGSLELIDGHLRAEEMGDQPVAVIVTDLTADEAKKLLLVYDPIGELADADKDRLRELLRTVELESPALLQMCEELAAKHFDPPDEESVGEKAEPAIKEQYHVLIVAKDGRPLTEAQQVELLESLSDQSYEVKALTS